jgi:hypothetical protein
MSVLLPYLLSHRTRLAAASDGDSSADPSSSANDDGGIDLPKSANDDEARPPAAGGGGGGGGGGRADLAGLTSEQREALFVLIDTAVLKACGSGHLHSVHLSIYDHLHSVHLFVYDHPPLHTLVYP